MALLDRWGVGVSQVIGLGGRDLSAEVGGRMARSAIDALREDPATEVILVVSKPPSPDVAAAVLAGSGRTPIVAALIGLDPATPAPPGVVLADTLESGVVATLRTLGRAAPDTTVTRVPRCSTCADGWLPNAAGCADCSPAARLCYESLVVLGRVLGAVHSNTPLNPAWGLPAPRQSHQCLDLGEEEYTRGRPHPMIDPEARLELLAEHAADRGGGRDHSRRGAGLWGESEPSRDAGARVRGRDGRRRSAGRRVRPRHRSRSAGLSRTARRRSSTPAASSPRPRAARRSSRPPSRWAIQPSRPGRCDDQQRVRRSAARRAGQLLDEAPRGRRAHAVSRRGARPSRCTRSGGDARRSRSGILPQGAGAVPSDRGTPAGRDAGATGLQLDRCARRRSR